jgi:hypothetical protein
LGLAGLYLGWQASVSTGLIAAAGMVVLAGGSRLIAPLRAIPPVAAAGVAVLVQILGWRWLSGLPCWPSHDASPVEMAGALALIALLSGLSRWLRPRSGVSEGSESDAPSPVGPGPVPGEAVGTAGLIGGVGRPRDAPDLIREGGRASAP